MNEEVVRVLVETGEKSWLREQEIRQAGVPLDPRLRDSLNKLAHELHLPPLP